MRTADRCTVLEQPAGSIVDRKRAGRCHTTSEKFNKSSIGTVTASELTETNASGVPQMVFVDDKGLEEQILTEDEDTANVLDISANRLARPVDTTPTNLSIQQMQNEELDLQPFRGPREESIVNTIDQFLDENYEDVLRLSNIQTNFSLSASDRNVTGRPVLPLGWIIPNGTNRTLEEIKGQKDFK